MKHHHEEDGSSPLRFLIVGNGEIAQHAHLPTLRSRSDSFVIGLVDTKFTDLDDSAEVDGSSDGLPFFTSVHDAFSYFHGNIHAVSICTPKSATLAVARQVLQIAASSNESKLLGILLEKPPGDDIKELEQIVQYGTKHGISMFTACHTAACPARKAIDAWLFAVGDDNIVKSTRNKTCRRRLESIKITWKENVRKWHPGQTWISTASGGGVTDMLFNPISLIVSIFQLSFLSSQTPDTKTINSVETIDSIDNRTSTIRLMKADLSRPCNWEAPISGHAQLLMSVPLRDKDNEMNTTEVPITADFAFDYEPPDEDGHEEIWKVEFAEAISESEGRRNHPISLTITDGGAQAYIGHQRVTTEPTAKYPLEPEYEALYEHFLNILRRNRNGIVIESEVDCTTIAIVKEITTMGNYSVGQTFDF